MEILPSLKQQSNNYSFKWTSLWISPLNPFLNISFCYLLFAFLCILRAVVFSESFWAQVVENNKIYAI